MKRKPAYLLVSDLHFHNWSAFATTDKDGVNSRLRIILNELIRAAKMLKKLGGKRIVIAGDLFHVRGSVAPSVLNPVFETFRMIGEDMGLEVIAIAGNHDLEGNDATKLGNAMQSLGVIKGFHPITQPTSVPGDETDTWKIQLFPWYAELHELEAAMEAACRRGEKDHAIIHAPVNGVIKGIPDHGLEAHKLKLIGYRFVFAGHYHNHKVFEDGAVVSIGASTHQTWSDPDTKAGFMLVYADSYEHQAAEAPSFVDIPVDAITHEYPVSGNYVRMRLVDASESMIKTERQKLLDAGAKGVLINATKKVEVTRVASIKAGSSMEVSVSQFIEKDMKPPSPEKVTAAALAILTEVRS